MPQFFIQQLPAIGSEIRLHGGDAKHIAGSLRLKPGEWFVLSSGEGRAFDAEIVSASPHEVIARVSAERPRRRMAPLILAQAIVKGDKFESIIQKVVELGVARIIPFSSQRTIPQYVEAVSARKLERFREIARQAAIQSGLPFVPEVEPPTDFSTLIDQWAPHHRTLFFWEGTNDGAIPSLSTEQPTLVVIGPEGGFAPPEVVHVRRSKVDMVSLGQQILRVETAATVAVALCLYKMGELSCPSS